MARDLGSLPVEKRMKIIVKIREKWERLTVDFHKGYRASMKMNSRRSNI